MSTFKWKKYKNADKHVYYDTKTSEVIATIIHGATYKAFLEGIAFKEFISLEAAKKWCAWNSK